MESIERIDQTLVFMLPLYRFNLWIREVFNGDSAMEMGHSLPH